MSSTTSTIDATERAVLSIRSGAGPCFLEARTYRFRAHSMYDPELYRDKAEVEEWRRRDPVAATRQRIAGGGGDAAVSEIEHEVEAELASAVAFAEAGTWEPVDQLTDDVYTPATDRPRAH